MVGTRPVFSSKISSLVHWHETRRLDMMRTTMEPKRYIMNSDINWEKEQHHSGLQKLLEKKPAHFRLIDNSEGRYSTEFQSSY